MIPSNLVDRMKVVSDFDTLILRHMMIEMGVQSLCRPSGAAAEILTMFEETFRQDREGVQLEAVNGHVRRGRAALPAAESEVEETPKRRGYDKAKANKDWYRAALARKQEDPWRLAEWRKEILRWASENGWVFNVRQYRDHYESQNKRKLTDTYCKTTIGDMQNRQHFLKRIGEGRFAITDAGKRATAGLDLSQPVQNQPEKTESKKAVAQKSRYAEAGDPFDTAGWRKEIYSVAAAKHNGEFVMSDYAKHFNSSHNVTLGNTKIYSVLYYMVERGQATKLKDGVYRLTQAGRKAASELGINIGSAAPQKKTAPAKKASPAKKATPVKKKSGGPHHRPASEGPVTPETLLEYAARHDGNIFTNDFIKEHKTSVGSTYTNLANLQAEKRVEKITKGHFRVLEPVAAPQAEAASA